MIGLWPKGSAFHLQYPEGKDALQSSWCCRIQGLLLLFRLLTWYFFRVDSSCPFVWSWAWTSPFFSLVTVSKASFKRSTASWTDWSTSRTLSRLHQTRYAHYLPSGYCGKPFGFSFVKDKFRISNLFLTPFTFPWERFCVHIETSRIKTALRNSEHT